MAHPKLTVRHFTNHCEGAGNQIGPQTIAVQILTKHGHDFIEFIRRERFETIGRGGDLTQKILIEIVAAKTLEQGAANGAGRRSPWFCWCSGPRSSCPPQ